VTIDHYVKEPEVLRRDIDVLASQSGGKIVIGEIGSPIPDIHGRQTEKEQDEWLGETFAMLAMDDRVIGVNYWVLTGGTTELYTQDGKKKPAADTLTRFFTGDAMEVLFVNEQQTPISGVRVSGLDQSRVSNAFGIVTIPVLKKGQRIEFEAEGYKKAELTSEDNAEHIRVILRDHTLSLWDIIPFVFEFRWPF
jgi:hypothetical protein